MNSDQQMRFPDVRCLPGAVPGSDTMSRRPVGQPGDRANAVRCAAAGRIRRGLVLVACLVVAFLSPSTGQAQRTGGVQRFAADMVNLKTGERLRGALLGRSPDDVISMAVRRAWLQKHAPRIYERMTGDEATIAADSLGTLRTRIQAWIDEKPKSRVLAFFLAEELRRVEQRIQELPDQPLDRPEFLIVTFPAAQAELLVEQAAANRHIAALAWHAGLKDVETREVRDLAAELTRRDIDLAQPNPDLTDRLPSQLESDQQWAARRALVEFHHGERVEFQGMGSTVFRTGDKAPQADLAELLPKLLPQLLQQQLGGDLADLLDGVAGPANSKQKSREPDLAAAIETARTAGVRGFRVTLLDLNPARGQVSVEERFVARMPNDAWQIVWRHIESGDASQPRPDLEARIRKDPQVSQALKLLEGLGGAAGQSLQTSLRFGAATMDAQQKSGQVFTAFLERWLDRLDSPPLIWPAP